MIKYKTGYINSIETLGLVDGEGIRVVVFLQGCPLRCLFCHNPETWIKGGKEVKSNEIIDIVRKYRPFIELGGGVTFSGGEPLFQSEFLLDLLKLSKKAGINTCIDTSGTGYTKEYLDEILKYTDLVLLDIKAIDPDNYKRITGKSMDMFNYFKEKVAEHNTRLWLRQVIVPGINDNEEYILKLKKYIKEFKNVEKVELLPYHTLGVSKYEKLGLEYRLKGTPDMDKKRVKELEELLK